MRVLTQRSARQGGPLSLVGKRALYLATAGCCISSNEICGGKIHRRPWKPSRPSCLCESKPNFAVREPNEKSGEAGRMRRWDRSSPTMLTGTPAAVVSCCNYQSTCESRVAREKGREERKMQREFPKWDRWTELSGHDKITFGMAPTAWGMGPTASGHGAWGCSSQDHSTRSATRMPM
jgi:hypothetical protein